MKNFRKSIIALATAAAMLIPSVAMAATLTTTVDKDIDGDVYVGFYDGAVLKDVVKTTVADATVEAAATAGEELPCTVTITDEVYADSTRTDVEVRSLVFTAKAAASINQFNIIMSYDSNVIQPVKAVGSSGDFDVNTGFVDESKKSNRCFTLLENKYYSEDEEDYVTDTFASAGTQVATVGNRVGLSFNQFRNGTTPINDGVVLTKFLYYVKAGQTVTADTFRIETDLKGDFLSIAGFASPGSENGIRLYNPDGGYTYGCWSNGAAVDNTITLVTPWDVQESTTKTLEVEVPAGAENYKATMFIWDADQIAQCAPIALN